MCMFIIKTSCCLAKMETKVVSRMTQFVIRVKLLFFRNRYIKSTEISIQTPFYRHIEYVSL